MEGHLVKVGHLVSPYSKGRHLHLSHSAVQCSAHAHGLALPPGSMIHREFAIRMGCRSRITSPVRAQTSTILRHLNSSSSVGDLVRGLGELLGIGVYFCYLIDESFQLESY